MTNRIKEIFGIEYPVIAGGMAWCSGWRLAAAVSNAGGLGLIGAGTMTVDLLREHIRKVKAATDKPWGINLPLMYPQIDTLIDMVIEEGCKIVFTSAGSPKKYTKRFHDAGMTVAHVVSSSKFAKKCEEAGVDVVVAEGFEAGGHNGREETTTMCLIPQVRQTTTLPVIAAGGIASGAACLAAQVLGAEGVQIGTLFAMSEESSAAEAFKQRCTELQEGDTMLCLKKLAPSRLVKNALYARIAEAEERGADVPELLKILGEKATRRGIFDGDIENGEMEIGQIASAIKKIEPVSVIMQRLVDEYNEALAKLK
ncbi:MAG: nitronate monooxygenase [Prevotellaceae bacterium]|nr:nitronate monooxygenase [Prevotellaceae bacterium]MDY2749785.1 nitronate monooxygenase [Prevotella sp.]